MFVEVFESYKRVLRSRRFLVLISVFCGAVSVMSLSSKEFQIVISEFFPNIPNSTFVFVMLLASSASLGLIYLQSGGDDTASRDDLMMSREYLEQAAKSQQLTEMKIVELSKKIEAYESERDLTEEEKQLVIDKIVEQANEESIKDIFKDEAERLKNDLKNALGLEHLKDASSDIIRRLRREISDLRLRSNVNLLIGMSITAGGLYLLWSTVSMVDGSELLKQLASENGESNSKFIKNLVLPLVPRVMLVIFVEVFAYFFLRLYKNGLDEIKYFQNELTNIESKLSAVQFAFITNNEPALKVSLEALANTERNFILNKGQTTVELEKAKSESELTRNIITTIPDLFKKMGKQ
ncbi:hypothetical protein M2G63_22080 [Vibrio vulnificus]|uniref:hypothetical protein n=1 Tax=Vibrio parahaemolyticus TaxID=670 RepID=UPI001E333D18|nr:hypothetical protein [Vibrio parahaemolyticus]MCR9813577.1 hypothetical protein [Vibrio parahaemolyticus]MCU8395890.1 hypothetical protein [Vibrio vulnificus]MCU8540735.1 hypothetical protein [Vibrio vulnificus]MCU8545162.1 hypothetical protein [Vibrio vulnificus]